MRRMIWAWRQLGRDVIDLNDWRLRDAIEDMALGIAYLAGALAMGGIWLAGVPS